jgi:hypothetical protein
MHWRGQEYFKIEVFTVDDSSADKTALAMTVVLDKKW